MSDLAVDSRIVAALDTADAGRIEQLATDLAPVVGRVKIGLEAYTAHGPAAVEAAHRALRRGDGADGVFLDLKLHDIPTTVGRAAAVAADLGVAMLTVHASGGPRMVAAAVGSAPGVAVLGVTVLTSLHDAELAAVGQDPAARQVSRLARLAVDAGAAGLVCAAGDVARLRAELGPEPLLVVPGIRPAGAAVGDQLRTGTPASAVRAGADWLVIGRPITTAADPAAAARRINEEIASGHAR